MVLWFYVGAKLSIVLALLGTLFQDNYKFTKVGFEPADFSRIAYDPQTKIIKRFEVIFNLIWWVRPVLGEHMTRLVLPSNPIRLNEVTLFFGSRCFFCSSEVTLKYVSGDSTVTSASGNDPSTIARYSFRWQELSEDLNSSWRRRETDGPFFTKTELGKLS